MTLLPIPAASVIAVVLLAVLLPAGASGAETSAAGKAIAKVPDRIPSAAARVHDQREGVRDREVPGPPVERGGRGLRHPGAALTNRPDFAVRCSEGRGGPRALPRTPA